MAIDSEVWKNTSKGTAVVVRYDNMGHLTKDTVRPGSTFSVSTEERKVHQQGVRNEENDAYSNGMFQPVKLVESADDYESIAENPNHIEEGEMAALFKLPVAKFRERIALISNALAMDRIVELAEDESTNARLPLVKAAQERRDALRPSWKGQEPDEDGGGFTDFKVKGVSPN